MKSKSVSISNLYPICIFSSLASCNQLASFLRPSSLPAHHSSRSKFMKASFLLPSATQHFFFLPRIPLPTTFLSLCKPRLQEFAALGNHFEIPSAWPGNRAIPSPDAFVGPSPSTPDWDSSVFPSGSLPHSKPCHFGVSPIRFRDIPVYSPLHRCWGQALDTAYPRRGYRTRCQTCCLGELLHLWFPKKVSLVWVHLRLSPLFGHLWYQLLLEYSRHRAERAREAPDHSSHGYLKLEVAASTPGVHQHELAPSDVPCITEKTVT